MTRPTRRRGQNAATPLDLLAAVEEVAKAAGHAYDPAGPPDRTPQIGDTPILDARGYPRAIATTREFHLGREPRNKGNRYKANPPTVTECMAMLDACDDTIYGRRTWAAIILLWQGALRAFEALALTELDLDQGTGAIHVQHGKGDKPATIKMAAWAWPYLDEWRAIRKTIANPQGSLLCVLDGPTRGRQWSYSDLNKRLKLIALEAGVTKRISPHQFRHGWAVHAYQDKMPLRALQLHLRHENIGITDTYLQGLGVAESQQQVYEHPVPTVPATALLRPTRNA